MSWRRKVMLFGAVLVIGTSLRVAPAAAAPPTAIRPAVINNDAPDPTIVSNGGTYFAFTTDVPDGFGWINVPVYHSTNLSTWTYDRDALPTLGAWAATGLTWAPSVEHIGAQWVLYYTAHHAQLGVQCIGVAVASQPVGPYTDSRGAPLVCQSDQGGSIDPSSFVDTNGNRWLLWKSDNNAIGGAPIIWSQRLSQNGQSLTGAAAALLVNDRAWENGLIEGPSLIKAAGVYWLFYSAGYWSSWEYSVGYATCAGPAGPCTKQTQSGPWLHSAIAQAAGPGGASLSTLADGTVAMAFHGWARAVGYENGGYRAMYVEPVDFSTGAPRWRPDWSRTGGPAKVGAPVVASSSPGTLDVLAVTSGGPLFHRDVTGGVWSGWESLGGGMISGPAAASPGPNELAVFVHGSDHRLWQRASDGSGWSAWQSLGGTVVDGPAAASPGPDALAVFVHGTDHAMWHRVWDGSGWSAWQSLGGSMIGGPAAVSAGGGTLDVFVHGTDHALWHRVWDGSVWSAWESLSGGLSSDPSAASPQPGRITVAVGGLDSDAWARSWNGTSWSPWAKLLPSG